MKVILKTKHTNIHGEKMTLILDKKANLLFKHTDCNDRFENLKDILKTVKLSSSQKKTLKTKENTAESFKYVLDTDEKTVFSSFLDQAKKVIDFRLTNK